MTCLPSERISGVSSGAGAGLLLDVQPACVGGNFLLQELGPRSGDNAIASTASRHASVLRNPAGSWRAGVNIGVSVPVVIRLSG